MWQRLHRPTHPQDALPFPARKTQRGVESDTREELTFLKGRHIRDAGEFPRTPATEHKNDIANKTNDLSAEPDRRAQVGWAAGHRRTLLQGTRGRSMLASPVLWCSKLRLWAWLRSPSSYDCICRLFAPWKVTQQRAFVLAQKNGKMNLRAVNGSNGTIKTPLCSERNGRHTQSLERNETEMKDRSRDARAKVGHPRQY